jgi:hypothetical protein
VTSFASPPELVEIAKSAIFAGAYDVAARALKRALAAAESDVRAEAASLYAFMLRGQGAAAAEISQLYDLAISIGEPAMVRHARFSYASYLWKQGKYGEAESLYRQVASEPSVADPGEVNLIAWSQLNLARLLDQVGLRDEAVAAYAVALCLGMCDAERLDLLRADRNAPLEPYWQHIGVDPSVLTPEEALEAARGAAHGNLKDERRNRALLLRALDSDKKNVVADAAKRIGEWLKRDDQAQARAQDRLVQLGVNLAPATNAHETTSPEAASELPRETNLSAHVTVRGAPDPQSGDGPAVLAVAVAAEVALATAGRLGHGRYAEVAQRAPFRLWGGLARCPRW